LRFAVLRLIGMWLVGSWLIPEAATQAQTVVPFRLIDGWAIVLEGTLAGESHQKMLIDTGAVPSAINVKVARRLGLSGPERRLSLMNRAVTVERVRVTNVRAGAVAVEAMEMVAMDLQRIEQALGTRIDAVIGLDLLSRQNFSIDYRRRELAFSRNPVAAGAIPFETKEEAGKTYILIPLQSNGERLQMLLDTGVRDMVLFKPRLRGHLQQLRVQGSDFNLNAGGQDSLAVVEMPSVELGSFSWKKRKAYIWGTPPDQLRDFDGMVGPAALGALAIAFDFDRRVISFEIP
jgi:predicted aspartyl protease